MATMTAEACADILTQRAALHGGTLGDILNETPVCLWDSPDELLTFWEGKDLSHIKSQSLYPELAQDWDNIVPEDPGPNRARGSDTMTDTEVDIALLDGVVDAEFIDIEISNDSVEFLDALLTYVD